MCVCVHMWSPPPNLHMCSPWLSSCSARVSPSRLAVQKSSQIVAANRRQGNLLAQTKLGFFKTYSDCSVVLIAGNCTKRQGWWHPLGPHNLCTKSLKSGVYFTVTPQYKIVSPPLLLLFSPLLLSSSFLFSSCTFLFSFSLYLLPLLLSTLFFHLCNPDDHIQGTSITGKLATLELYPQSPVGLYFHIYCADYSQYHTLRHQGGTLHLPDTMWKPWCLSSDQKQYSHLDNLVQVNAVFRYWVCELRNVIAQGGRELVGCNVLWGSLVKGTCWWWHLIGYRKQEVKLSAVKDIFIL